MQATNIDRCIDQLEGNLISSKYMVGRMIDEGSFGQVYKIVDIADQSRPLVMKVCPDYKVFGHEINTMKRVHKKQ